VLVTTRFIKLVRDPHADKHRPNKKYRSVKNKINFYVIMEHGKFQISAQYVIYDPPYTPVFSCLQQHVFGSNSRPCKGELFCLFSVKSSYLNFNFNNSLRHQTLGNWAWLSYTKTSDSLSRLTFQSLPVTLRHTRLNVQKFCMLVTLHLCVLYGSQNKQ
jgi:hypothetical protein